MLPGNTRADEKKLVVFTRTSDLVFLLLSSFAGTDRLHGPCQGPGRYPQAQGRVWRHAATPYDRVQKGQEVHFTAEGVREEGRAFDCRARVSFTKPNLDWFSLGRGVDQYSPVKMYHASNYIYGPARCVFFLSTRA